MTADLDVARAVDMTRELADDCAKAALARFGDVQTRAKADGSLVTEVDTQTERRIRSVLTQAYPTHCIFGEEDGAGGVADSLYMWLIDPIDGTNNFIAGLPLWGVSIGLFFRGEPLLGALAMPCLEQVFWAAEGMGAYVDGQPISVRTGTCLQRNDLVMISSPHIKPWDFEPDVKYRIMGSAAYSMTLVAAGVAIGMINAHWHSWDVGAAFCLLREAGALATDVTGKSLYNILEWDYRGSGPCMVVASPEYHALLMEHIDPTA